MAELTIHGIERIELKHEWLQNGGSRSVMISGRDHLGRQYEIELSLFGNTEAVAALPKAPDFYRTDEPGPVIP